MRQFAILAAVLIGGGVAIGMLIPENFSLGGWFIGAVLLLSTLAFWRTSEMP
jgi:hypothetical protein